MKSILLIVFSLGSALFSSSAAQPPEFTLLRQQYEKALAERATIPFEAALAQLKAKFNTALENAASTAKAAGDLETVLALQADQKRLQENLAIPEDDDRTPEVLKPLRAIYREQVKKLEGIRAGTAGTLLPPYTARLQQLEATLTKANRIEEAKEIKTYREGLSATFPVPTAPSTGPAMPGPSLATAPVLPDVKGDDRAAAETVFKYRGVIRLKNNETLLTRLEDLPKGRFAISEIDFKNSKEMVLEAADADKLAGLGELTHFRCSHGPFMADDQLRCLATFPKLQRLNVENCTKLTGAWLQYLGRHHLIRLVIISSMNSDTSGISQIHGDYLEELQLRNTAIDDSTLAFIGRWKKLRVLGMRFTKITDGGMEQLAGLVNLASLDVLETSLTSAGLKHLSRLPVESLGFGLKTSDPEYLAEISRMAAVFPKVTRFVATVGQISAAHVQAVGKSWPAINKLSFPSFARFDDDAFNDLALYLPKLNTLDFWSSQVTDNHIGQLVPHRQISHLFVHDTKLTDLCLPHLERMRSLKRVDLANTATTEGAVAALRKARPDLNVSR